MTTEEFLSDRLLSTHGFSSTLYLKGGHTIFGRLSSDNLTSNGGFLSVRTLDDVWVTTHISSVLACSEK